MFDQLDKLIMITKNNSNLVSVAGGVSNLQSKEATVLRMMGKTATGTATEGICRETGNLFSRVPTRTLSTKRTKEADWDTNDEAIFFFFFFLFI